MPRALLDEEQSAPEQKPAAQMTVIHGGVKRGKQGSGGTEQKEREHRIAG